MQCVRQSVVCSTYHYLTLLVHQRPSNPLLSLFKLKLTEQGRSSTNDKQQWLTELNSYKKEKNQLDELISKSINESSKIAKPALSNSADHSWNFPLRSGVITSRFGTQKDQINKGIIIIYTALKTL